MNGRPPNFISSEFRLILAAQDAANYKQTALFSCYNRAVYPLLLALVKGTSLAGTLKFLLMLALHLWRPQRE